MSVQQYDLFGKIAPPQGLDIRDKVAYVLEQHPETRDNDTLLTLWYWWEWSGLADWLTETQFDLLLKWAVKNAELPETIRRRRQEIQLLRSGKGSLQPSATVAAFRREQDGAGPVGRRK